VRWSAAASRATPRTSRCRIPLELCDGFGEFVRRRYNGYIVGQRAVIHGSGTFEEVRVTGRSWVEWDVSEFPDSPPQLTKSGTSASGRILKGPNVAMRWMDATRQRYRTLDGYSASLYTARAINMPSDSQRTRAVFTSHLFHATRRLSGLIDSHVP